MLYECELGLTAMAYIKTLITIIIPVVILSLGKILEKITGIKYTE